MDLESQEQARKVEKMREKKMRQMVNTQSIRQYYLLGDRLEVLFISELDLARHSNIDCVLV